MPKRAGKAVSRRARQRPVHRHLDHVRLPAPQSDAVPPVGTPDAREAISLDPPRRVIPPADADAGSGLTSRDRAAYHYVERDLRNIGVLTAVMLLALVAAWFLFSQLGLIG
jgi:hypothetical protein